MNTTMPGVATSHLCRVSALLVLALSLATGLSVLVVVPRASGFNPERPAALRPAP